jgi:transmembrane sensor
MSPRVLITKDLLFAYFAGQATALQKQAIETWLEDSSNEEFFYATLHEWETKHLEYRADVNQAIQNFHQQLLNQNAPVATRSFRQGMHSSKTSRSWKRWLAAAAVFLIIGSFSWCFKDYLLFRTYSTDFGETSALVLSDNSQVILNANSSLRVPRFGFGRSSRKVFLNGEANFSVVHTPDDMKFIVQTDSLFQVEVLGTEFTVFARERQTKVVLSKGKVKVQYGNSEEIITPLTMTPGDLVAVDKKQKKLQVTKVTHPENYSSWRENRFIFENTSLKEVKDILHENYGLEVEIEDDHLEDKTISGSFQARSANELLQAISEVLHINVLREDNHVILIDNK